MRPTLSGGFVGDHAGAINSDDGFVYIIEEDRDDRGSLLEHAAAAYIVFR